MSKLFAIILLSFAFSACTATKTNSGEKNTIASVQKSLDRHLSQWKKQGFNKYSYEFRRGCFCLPDYTKPVLIQVKNDTVTDARFKDNNKQLTEALKGNRQTINMLFKTIQDAIDRKAHSIKVKYNEQYGYPASIVVDYDERMADEELYLNAKDLKPL